MTAEKRIGLVVYPRADGYVSLGIHYLDENGKAIEKIIAVGIKPETAREAAQRLTLSSWKVEEMSKEWREGQTDGLE